MPAQLFMSATGVCQVCFVPQVKAVGSLHAGDGGGKGGGREGGVEIFQAHGLRQPFFVAVERSWIHVYKIHEVLVLPARFRFFYIYFQSCGVLEYLCFVLVSAGSRCACWCRDARRNEVRFGVGQRSGAGLGGGVFQARLEGSALCWGVRAPVEK